MISPAVITSKIAQKDYSDIEAKHSDLLQNMAVQSVKVQTYHQQRAVEAQVAQQNAQTMQAEIQKQAMVAQTEQQKQVLDFSQKQAELDIKRASLSAV